MLKTVENKGLQVAFAAHFPRFNEEIKKLYNENERVAKHNVLQSALLLESPNLYAVGSHYQATCHLAEENH